MKKLVKAVLIGTIALSLAACGEKDGVNSEDSASTVEGQSISTENGGEQATDAQPSEAGEATDAQPSEAEQATDAQPSEAEEATAPDYSGTFVEPVAGRCTITIEALGNNNYTVNVHWSSSAFESANWEINATYYESTGLLEYTGAKYFVRTYADEETYEDDVKYEDGAGEFWFEEDGKLGWRSANSDVDGITGETLFEKVEIVE